VVRTSKQTSFDLGPDPKRPSHLLPSAGATGAPTYPKRLEEQGIIPAGPAGGGAARAAALKVLNLATKKGLLGLCPCGNQ